MVRVDYAVVGGGVTGVCAAYHLAKGGADVLVIERDQLAPDSPISSSGEHGKAFRSAYGKDRRMTRLAQESFQYWKQFEHEAGTELFVPSGMIVFGADQARTLAHWSNPGVARFAIDSAETLAEEGLAHELLSKQDLVSRYPQIAANDFYDHAILDKTAGFVHARKAVRAIGALATRAGAAIWDHTTVERCVRDGSDVERLITSRGDVVPRVAVIFAAGYMNSTLAPELGAKTRVTQQQLLHITPADPEPYMPSRFPIVVNINQWRYVFPVHGPGVMKVADDDKFRRDKIIDPRHAPQTEADDWFRTEARDFLRDYVPGLAAAEEVGSTTCRYTNTVSDDYLIYRTGNTVVISACSGHGFKNAPVTALMATALATAQPPAPDWKDAGFGYGHAADF